MGRVGGRSCCEACGLEREAVSRVLCWVSAS